MRGIATDSSGHIDTISIIVNVTDLNDPGTVALSPLTPAVDRPFTATLTEPDVGSLDETWTWSWATTPAGAFTTISGANSATYAPVAGDEGRYLKAAVSYTDAFGSGQSAEQVSAKAVAPNPAPEFANPSVTLTVNENATSGTVGTVAASDPEGETITHTVGGADAAAFDDDFSFGSTSGTITVKSGATIDYESAPSYSITITATDASSVTADADVTINVTNINEPGTVVLSPAAPAVGKPIGATPSDPDGSVSDATWTWAWSTTRTGTFTTIGSANSATYTPVTGDVGRYLKASVSYTDVHGGGQSASETTLTTVAPNLPPAFDSASETFAVNEKATTGTVGTARAVDPESDTISYSVSGADATVFNEDFDVGYYGGINVKSDAIIDYETRTSYSVTITATDPSGGSDTISVTINVTNVDEPGVVGLSGATPQVSTSLIANLTDPDGGVTSPTWTWAWSATRTGTFTTISGANTAAYSPVTGDVGRYLKASVSYTDTLASGRTAAMTSANAVVASGEISPNQVAQGVPSIAGTPEPGLRLVADTSEITDGNGLGTFSYQWLRVNAGTPTDIPQTNRSTYVVHPDDLGKVLRVRVSFTDSDGYAESVTSADVAVASPPSYLVSNLAKRTTTSYGNYEVFQSFTTGAGYGGFEGVRLGVGALRSTAPNMLVPGTDVRVAIWSDVNGIPYKRELILTSPAEIDDDPGTLEFFSASDATLNPNTTYWVGVEKVGLIVLNLAQTSADAEDAGGQSDWSIADVAYLYSDPPFHNFSPADPPYSLQLGIVGEAVDTVTNHPAEGDIPIVGTLEEGLWVSALPSLTPSYNGINISIYPDTRADLPDFSDGNFLRDAANGATFQWIRVDGGIETNIGNPQASSVYSLQAADVGKALKVTFSFRDDAGFSESLTSNATQVVLSAPIYQLSNLNQIGEVTVTPSSGGELAQPFTTGAAPKVLTKVRLRMGADRDNRRDRTLVPVVSIFSDDNGVPGRSLLLLTNPTSVDEHVFTVNDFTTTGLRLAANTKYWVVVDWDRLNYSAVLTAIRSKSADDSSTDWVISDYMYYYKGGTGWIKEPTNLVAQLGIVVTDELPTPTVTGAIRVTGILEQGLTVVMHSPEQVSPDLYRLYGKGWIRIDGETETDVGTVNTYTIQPGDVGKQLKAWESYWDATNDPDKENLFVVYSEPTDVVRSASSYLGSNLGEVQDGGRIVSAVLFPVAQAFTTGTDPHALTGVRLQLKAESGVEPQISIYSDSSGSPGTSLQVLTNPTSIDASTKTTEGFTASGVTLSANTKYWVVVESPSGGEIVVGITRSPGQETGWSIGDSYYVKTSGAWGEYDFAGRQWALMLSFLGEQVFSAPQFETKPLTVSAVENTTDASQVVATITASQEDIDPLTYSVGGADATAFNEDFNFSTTDGAISYKSDGTIDYETRASYMITVSVTDGEDASGNFETVATVDDTVIVTINVTNVDEAGGVALSPAIRR